MVDDEGVGRLVGSAAAVREVFERLPAIAVGLRGAEHQCVAANAAYRTFLAGRPDILGRPIREVLPDVRGQQIIEMLDRVFRTGRPESGREWRVQLAIVAPDTRHDRYLDFTAVPHRENGSVTGLVVYGHDVTERVLERQAVRDQLVEAERRYEQVREVVTVLQEALLPAGLPVLPGVDIAARYLVAEAEQAAGGDWFDAIPLADGKVALVVGDVVGHGVVASAVMGQLRAVLADQLVGGAGLAAAVARTQRYAERHQAARATTVCAAVLDPTNGDLEYVTCGHPAPLVVGADGETRFLASSGGRPLGTRVDGATGVTTVRAAVHPDEVLLIYSDGLVERPGEPLVRGQEELAEVAATTAANRAFPLSSPESTVRRVCAQTVELVTRRAGARDDVTVLAVQRRSHPIETFEQEMPARAGLLGLLRQRLEEWLRVLGASSDDVLNVQIAAVEAVTNAVEHAYPPGTEGLITVLGRLAVDGCMELTVSDTGAWRPLDPEPGLRGRGLVLMRRCMREVTVERSEAGTTVRMSRLLRADAVLDPSVAGRPAREPEEPPEFSFRVERAAAGQPSRVAVFGPVDLDHTRLLRRVLSEAARGGVVPLLVDLTGVTHLSSSGVQLLTEFADGSAGVRPLRLVAPPGCVARYVLELTGLVCLVAPLE